MITVPFGGDGGNVVVSCCIVLVVSDGLAGVVVGAVLSWELSEQHTPRTTRGTVKMMSFARMLT
jgi:hypothetical protein